MKPIEINGNQKVILKIAEVIAILGVLLALTWRTAIVSTKIDAILLHVKTDWTLQHEIIMADRMTAAYPTMKDKYPDPVKVADDIRRSTE